MCIKNINFIYNFHFIFFLLSCNHEDNSYEWFVEKLNMTMINNIDISNVTIAILIAGYNKEVINKYERNITEK